MVKRFNTEEFRSWLFSFKLNDEKAEKRDYRFAICQMNLLGLVWFLQPFNLNIYCLWIGKWKYLPSHHFGGHVTFLRGKRLRDTSNNGWRSGRVTSYLTVPSLFQNSLIKQTSCSYAQQTSKIRPREFLTDDAAPCTFWLVVTFARKFDNQSRIYVEARDHSGIFQFEFLLSKNHTLFQSVIF